MDDGMEMGKHRDDSERYERENECGFDWNWDEMEICGDMEKFELRGKMKI